MFWETENQNKIKEKFNVSCLREKVYFTNGKINGIMQKYNDYVFSFYSKCQVFLKHKKIENKA